MHYKYASSHVTTIIHQDIIEVGTHDEQWEYYWLRHQVEGETGLKLPSVLLHKTGRNSRKNQLVIGRSNHKRVILSWVIEFLGNKVTSTLQC